MLKSVNQPIRKKDAMALVTGKPVYMDDLGIFDHALIVKALRSPHAHAMIESIDTKVASRIPGIEAIFTYEDVPNERFTLAGQTYPELSPYDRLIMDRHIRCVGDPVALVAGTDEKAIDRALKAIKVKYEILPALLDFHDAIGSDILVHPEDNWKALDFIGADNKTNRCASETTSDGDVEAVLADCDIVIDHVYHTKANQQTMMETFRTGCYMDTYGRLNIVSSTQIVYHVRRIISHALGIPKSRIRVQKPRIGGGFGAKQSAVCEVYPAFVTYKTGKPCKMIYSRVESQIISSPRHEMDVHVRLGAMKNGRIRAMDIYTLSNTGAYGEHGPTTVGLSGHKSIPLYTTNLEAWRFAYDVVYTNVMSAGAYRGYGATQGIFAVESAVNELAARIGMDPTLIREMNMVREGQVMSAYYNETNTSCALDRCMERAKEMIGWNEKPLRRVMPDGKIRSLGVAMAMQGSGISGVDVGSATIKIDDDGGYNLLIAAADMGTGCDTILAQIAAEVLECPVDQIAVHGADTDTSPYDSGSYASSTTYITGKATEIAAQKLKVQMTAEAAKMLSCQPEDLDFDGKCFTAADGQTLTIKDLATRSMCGFDGALETTISHSSPVSPPPYMVGIAEIELDPETGEVYPLDYVAVVDCGTPINPNLARTQTIGGLLQGIGMALYEEIQYSDKGRLYNNSFMQYKIPSRVDLGHIRVDFESSYEPSGPFGAKSIGEIVIDTPSPALAHAIYNATGLWFRELPITAEKIAMGLMEKEKNAQNAAQQLP